jgi:L-lactate dehydrogenase complex protein LldE
LRQTISNPPRVGLFVTCLVDLFRPAVGLAAIKLLRDAGCVVEVPPAQNCCGRSAAGDAAEARATAQETIRAFEDYDHVIAPSPSCADMLRNGYPALFNDDPLWKGRARAFSAKVHELVDFFGGAMGVTQVEARMTGSVTLHEGCAASHDTSRALLASIDGVRLKDMRDAGACCGFGGCAPSDTSPAELMRRKTKAIRSAGAGTLVGPDLACLMGMAGRLKRDGSAIEVRHLAEVLAGMNDSAPIGSGG